MSNAAMNSEHRATATAAWQAYNAMETTKRRHLDYLSALESREKRFNLAPNDAENSMLKRLLTDHDSQVSAFKAAGSVARSGFDATLNALAWRARWVWRGLSMAVSAAFWARWEGVARDWCALRMARWRGWVDCLVL